MQGIMTRTTSRFAWSLAMGMSAAALPWTARAEEPGSAPAKTLDVRVQRIQLGGPGGEPTEDVLIRVEPGVEGAEPVVRPFDAAARTRIAVAQGGAPDGQEDRVFIFTNGDESNSAVRAIQEVKLSEYWLGLECVPSSDAMRAQLGLDANQGLVVAQVVNDSPAAKGGFRQHDVLVKAADKPLGEVSDLMKVLDEVKENELEVAIIRGGKPETIKVQPAKRPQQDLLIHTRPGINWQGMRQLLQEHSPGNDARLRFNIVAPGAFVPYAAVEIPDNLSIHIHKQGNKPGQIEVQQGEQRWNVAENELDKLPDNVRKAVEQMLHGPRPHVLHLEGRMTRPFENGPFNFTGPRIDGGELVVQPPGAPQPPGAAPAPGSPPPGVPGGPEGPRFGGPPVGPWGPNRRVMDDLQKQLHDMQQQLKQLHDEVKQLRSAQPPK